MTTSTTSYRYPGTQPFSLDESKQFFGRKADITALLRSIRLRPTITLFGKSGQGKSSLVNAGLLAELEAKQYLPMMVRFGHCESGEDQLLPITHLIRALPEQVQEDIFLHHLTQGEPSLWQLAKQIQINHIRTQQTNPVLLFVFDQFEELFSYPHGKEDFAIALTSLLNDAMPSHLRRLLDQQSHQLSEEEWEALETPLQVKALFSVRSDRLSLLQGLSEYLPTVFQYRYELHPLSMDQAREAILAPAALTGAFVSQSFSFSSSALDQMLAYLSQNGRQDIESFQLQLICQHLEERMLSHPPQARDENGFPQWQESDLPNFPSLLSDYYEQALKKLGPEDHQTKARRLIEEGLILGEEERRLTVDAGQLKKTYQIDDSLLEKLVQIRLLRAESNSQQRLSFELSHDAFIAPVTKSRDKRLQLQRETQLKKEAQARMKQRLKLITIGAGILLLFVLCFFSWQLFQRNRELNQVGNQLVRAFRELGAFIQADEEFEELLNSENVLNKAVDLTTELEETRLLLQETKSRIEDFQTAASAFQEKIDREGTLSQEELIHFVQQSNQALDSLKVSPVLQVKADSFVLPIHLNEADKQQEIASMYQEAERLVERGRETQALYKYQQILLLDTSQTRAKQGIGRLNPKTPILGPSPDSANQIQANAMIEPEPRSEDSGTDPSTNNLTRSRLLQRSRGDETIPEEPKPSRRPLADRPKMIEVPGGIFMMGSEVGKDFAKPFHQVSLSPFYLAEKEVTNAQYCDFLNEKGNQTEGEVLWLDLALSNIEKQNGLFLPKTDMEQYPVTHVSWYGARAYCKWLGPEYRLPTEAEWEYAAGGGAKNRTTFSGTNVEASLKRYAVYKVSGLAQGGSRRANRLGLLDMTGNVWEWCQDWANRNYYVESQKKGTVYNPSGPKAGTSRVLRGGSWRDLSLNVSIARRNGKPPKTRDAITGFRPAKGTNEPPPRVIPKPKMIRIAGGTYSMGTWDGESDELPPHSVKISTFYLAETEVTNEQYCDFLNKKFPSAGNADSWIKLESPYCRIRQVGEGYEVEKGYEKHPVVYVFWKGAVAYCQWLGPNYRLPTEAEWEYVAGGGQRNRTRYAGTNSESNLDQYGVFGSNGTAEVASKKPNKLGLYDLSGNAWEWCQDWYSDRYYQECSDQGTIANPMGPTNGYERVYRGGDWYDGAHFLRVTHRGRYTYQYRFQRLSFRPSRKL